MGFFDNLLFLTGLTAGTAGAYQKSRPMLRRLFHGLQTNQKSEQWITALPGYQQAVHQFVAANSAESALAIAQAQPNPPTYLILDPTENLLTTLPILAKRPDSRVILSLSQLNNGDSADSSHNPLIFLVSHNLLIFLDGKDYLSVNDLLKLYNKAIANGRTVGITLDASLYRTAGDLNSLLPHLTQLRLSITNREQPVEYAFPQQDDTYDNYIALLQTALDQSKTSITIAHHDHHLIQAIFDAVREDPTARQRLVFEIPYGVRPDLLQHLNELGWKTTRTLPFGVHAYPYVMNRLADDPINLFWLVEQRQ